MASSDIELVGLGELVQDLERISTKMNKKALAKMLRPGAVIFQREIRAQAPVRTGTLRKSVGIKVGRGKSTDPTATLFTYFRKIYKTPKGKTSEPYYAQMVHNGTVVGTKKRKHRKPRTFSRSEERAYQRQRIAEGTVRIKPNPFVWRAYEAKVDAAAQAILETISKSVENE